MASSSDELPVGRIAGIFGVRGELKCDPTSAGRTLFSAGETLRMQLPDGTSRNVEISAVREHKNRLLIRLPGVDTADAAEGYAGAMFYANRDRIVLEPGEYLDRDLTGCRVYDHAAKLLGTVTAVEHYPSSDMLVVNGKLVPLIGEFIKSVDVASKRIIADLPLGLLDDSESL